MDAEATRPDLDADDPGDVLTGHRRIVSFLIFAVKLAAFTAPLLALRAALRPRRGCIHDLCDRQLADIGLLRHHVEHIRERPIPSHPWLR